MIWSLWLSGPIAVLTYGKAMVAFIWTLPPWLAVVVFFSHIIAMIGVGSLIDRQQERRQSSGSEQSGPLPQKK